MANAYFFNVSKEVINLIEENLIMKSAKDVKSLLIGLNKPVKTACLC